jgi:hypothetical protein
MNWKFDFSPLTSDLSPAEPISAAGLVLNSHESDFSKLGTKVKADRSTPYFHLISGKSKISKSSKEKLT